MDPNHSILPLQQLNANATSQTALFALPLTRQQLPQAPPGMSLHCTIHHTDRGLALTHALPQHVGDTTVPYAFEGLATSHRTNQCNWLVGRLPCGQCFLTFDELVVHLARQHDVQGPAERRIICEWCTHTGPCGNQYRRDAYRCHIATHLKVSYACTVADCNKSFSRVDSLRSHIRSKHTKG